jgi:hypothetical protein
MSISRSSSQGILPNVTRTFYSIIRHNHLRSIPGLGAGAAIQGVVDLLDRVDVEPLIKPPHQRVVVVGQDEPAGYPLQEVPEAFLALLRFSTGFKGARALLKRTPATENNGST